MTGLVCGIVGRDVVSVAEVLWSGFMISLAKVLFLSGLVYSVYFVWVE